LLSTLLYDSDQSANLVCPSFGDAEKLQKLRNLIRKQRTLGEPFELAET